MLRKQEEFKLFFNTNFLFLALFIAVLSFNTIFSDEPMVSDSSETIRITSEETTTYVDESGNETVVVEKETTVEDDDEDDGIPSTTLDIMGNIIALPFRLVASQLRAIF